MIGCSENFETCTTHHSEEKQISVYPFLWWGWSEPGMREIDQNYRKNIIEASEKIKTMFLNTVTNVDMPA